MIRAVPGTATSSTPQTADARRATARDAPFQTEEVDGDTAGVLPDEDEKPDQQDGGNNETYPDGTDPGAAYGRLTGPSRDWLEGWSPLMAAAPGP